ncbi:hypothetical protein J2X68_007580 [Streptomyces sp. 3330]|uniref:hypothetical protein n=1 Tax=Streptomyces sp. 3330 TaxID=2817755 RepID=UPI002858F7CD|nr:hypothetical protein [Streptomyces sp. 3330]MDR6980838.1 hypothetical protein [Streptomyces sp. 3330]
MVIPSPLRVTPGELAIRLPSITEVPPMRALYMRASPLMSASRRNQVLVHGEAVGQHGRCPGGVEGGQVGGTGHAGAAEERGSGASAAEELKSSVGSSTVEFEAGEAVAVEVDEPEAASSLGAC